MVTENFWRGAGWIGDRGAGEWLEEEEEGEDHERYDHVAEGYAQA